jgi:PIN domain nuclease of toxin-antitoxin system
LWVITEGTKLSQRAQQIYTGNSRLVLSVASVWEILIKVKAGKLNLPQPCVPYLVRKLAENRIDVLPITLDHVLRIEALEIHHGDPFDRILIAQSIEELLPTISADPIFSKYPVEIIW